MHILKRISGICKSLNNGRYIRFYYGLPVEEKSILIEMENEIFISQVLENLVRAIPFTMAEVKIYIVYNEKQYLKKYCGIKEVIFIKKNSKKYEKLLASAKWLFNDKRFSDRFIKKEGQIYTKLLATDVIENLKGNCKEVMQLAENRHMQLDCLQADYFICEEEQLQTLRKLPLLKNICKGRIFTLGKCAENLYLIFAHILKQEQTIIPERFYSNGKETVIMYLSALEKNGITTSCISLLSMLPLEKRNYIICYKDETNAEVFQRLDVLPEGVAVLGMENLNMTLWEFVCKVLYYKLKLNWKILYHTLDEVYEREFRRNLNNVNYDTLIQYTGYESDVIRIYGKTSSNKVIYVHSDMEREIALKKYQHLKTLQEAYREYDRVACVAEDVLPSTMRIGGEGQQYCIANNCHNYKEVEKKAKEEIELDKDTESTHTLEEIKKILNSDGRKIITIGRFSKEKGHMMLLDAFADYSNKCNLEVYLIIIGGYGALYKKTVQHAKELGVKERVIILKSLKNPMPILKKCDVFVLSSLYEGLGLVLLEAATLGIPIICTDIDGPRGFMKQHGGTLVSPEKEGILQGLEWFERGMVSKLDIDFQKYNQNCLQQFEKLFN